jgi:outer membrane immunogenic protein
VKKVALCVLAVAAFMQSPAGAADMPLKAPPPRPVMTWTGCYIGVEGGGNWGQTYSVAAAGPNVGAYHTLPYNVSGGLLGGTLGCNYQTGVWVIGVEGDFSWTNQTGSAFTPPPFVTTVSIIATERWLATARARLGYAAGNWLFFASGGAAWTQLNLFETTTPSESENRTLVGGTVGGGVEWMFAPRWSLKAEYLYVSYQSQQYFGVPCCTLENRYLTNNIGRVGVNLHF